MDIFQLLRQVVFDNFGVALLSKCVTITRMVEQGYNEVVGFEWEC